MAQQSKIEWTQQTWNPIRGCSKISPGCENCYAMAIAARFSGPGKAYEGLAKRNPTNWTGEVRSVEYRLGDPLRRRGPTTYFVNSTSDLFHEHAPDEWIDRILAVMALCGQHTFQALTKRADRLLVYFDGSREDRVYEAMEAIAEEKGIDDFLFDGLPLRNFWLGVSVENRQHGLPRIEHLRSTRAAVRFLSIEPLLEDLGRVDLSGIDWVIIGGESTQGGKCRACDVGWIRSIVEQCQAAGVACFVKQLGSVAVEWRGDFLGELPLTDKKGGDTAEWPEDLRVRQFPQSLNPVAAIP